MTARLAAAALAVVLVTAGCSNGVDATPSASTSDSPSASAPESGSGPAASVSPAPAVWSTPEDVIAALSSAGLRCVEEGQSPEIVPGLTADGQPWDAVSRIDCDGYSVFLWTDPASITQADLAACASFDQSAWEGLAERVGVTGENFAVATEGGTFPDEVPAEAFVAAFGGFIETDAEYFERIGCARP